MAIPQAQAGDKPGMAATLDEILDGKEWKTAINADDIGERADPGGPLRLVARKVGALAHTYIRMLGDNGRTRYVPARHRRRRRSRPDEGFAVWKACTGRRLLRTQVRRPRPAAAHHTDAQLNVASRLDA